MKIGKFVVQQGDVLIEECDGIPKDARKLSRDADGAVVLARGEVTGHRHAIYDADGVEIFDAGNGNSYIRVSRSVRLEHEEHGVAIINPGTYQVRGVQEYDHFAEEARRVID